MGNRQAHGVRNLKNEVKLRRTTRGTYSSKGGAEFLLSPGRNSPKERKIRVRGRKLIRPCLMLRPKGGNPSEKLEGVAF